MATIIGNAVKWFDFAAYAFLAVWVGQHFFAPGHDAAALLSVFAVFGVGVVARPLGAVLLGRLGDTRPRQRPMLIAALLCAVLPYAFFNLLAGTPSLAQVALVSIGAGVLVAVMAGIGPAAMFRTSQRTTGVSVSFGLATAIVSGLARLDAAAAALMSALTIARLRETAHHQFD